MAGMRAVLAAGLLYLTLVMPMLASPEITSVCALAFLLAWILGNRFRIPAGALIVSLPLVLVLGIGLLGAPGNVVWDVLRDVWYLGKSVVILVLGFVLAWYIDDLDDVLRVFLVVAGMIALGHVLGFILNPGVLNDSVADIRNEIGRGYLITVIALGILASCRRAGLKVIAESPWLRRMVFVLCSASIVLSLSRTFLISLGIVLLVCLGGLNVFKPRLYTAAAVRRFAITAVGCVALLAIAYQVASHTEAGTALLVKMDRSVDEIAAREYSHGPERALHWRGHEAHRAWIDYRSGSALEHVLGQGYGSRLDMGVYTRLGETRMRFVPTIHNGFADLMLKTGAAGVLLYLWFFFRLAWQGWRAAFATPAHVRVAGELIVGLSLTGVATTLVISGLMNKVTLNPAVLLLGALAAYTSRVLNFEVESEAEQNARKSLVLRSRGSVVSTGSP